MVSDEGYEVGFRGEYREIVPNRRIINTEAFEGFPEPDAYSVNTMTLVERDGSTTMTVLVEHQRPEHRDAHINSGMEAGMQDAYDLLEEAAITLGAEA